VSLGAFEIHFFQRKKRIVDPSVSAARTFMDYLLTTGLFGTIPA
jgi:hypothetical protein